MGTSLFETALETAAGVVHEVAEEHLHAPTPCEEWDVRALLNHMVNELAWVPELLAGKTIAQVGTSLEGDLLGEDPKHAWQVYAETARQAAVQALPHHVVHLSYGNVPASTYLQEVAGDILVHTWDLAKGIGKPFHIDEEVAKTVYLICQSKIPLWRENGLVGPEVQVPPDATEEVKLLGLFGRKAAWEHEG